MPALFTSTSGGKLRRTAHSQERSHARMERNRPIRLPVADMTPDEALAAVAFLERELAHMTKRAATGLAMLGRAAAGDRSMTRRELREVRAKGATLHRVQQPTARLRATVRVVQPAAAAP